MPQGYCIECRAHVTVRDGACLLGHSIDPTTIVTGSGRHRSRRTRREQHTTTTVASTAQPVRTPLQEPLPTPPPSPPLDPVPAPVAEPVHPVERPTLPPEPPRERRPDPEPWARPLLGRRRLPMLELLGFTEPDDAPIITDVSHLSPVMPPPDPRPSPIKKRQTAPVPRLADVRTTESTENTGVLVARLWEATDAEEPLGEDWTPAADIATPRRSFRWSFLITAAVVLSAIAAVVVFTSQWPVRQATELRQTLASGLAGLEAETPEVDAVRNIITDAVATSSDLTEVAIPLLGFSGAANTAYAAATADAGLELPLVSNAPVEALTPVKAELLRAADLALDIHDQVGDVLDYRVLVDQAFLLPAILPVEAGDERISEIGIELSDTLAATTDVLLRLPQNDLLADHRFQVESALADMSATVAAYLAALREQDGARASDLADQLRATSTDIRTELSVTLDRVDAWMVEALERLNGQLTTTRTAFQASA